MGSTNCFQQLRKKKPEFTSPTKLMRYLEKTFGENTVFTSGITENILKNLEKPSKKRSNPLKEEAYKLLAQAFDVDIDKVKACDQEAIAKSQLVHFSAKGIDAFAIYQVLDVCRTSPLGQALITDDKSVAQVTSEIADCLCAKDKRQAHLTLDGLFANAEDLVAQATAKQLDAYEALIRTILAQAMWPADGMQGNGVSGTTAFANPCEVRPAIDRARGKPAKLVQARNSFKLDDASAHAICSSLVFTEIAEAGSDDAVLERCASLVKEIVASEGDDTDEIPDVLREREKFREYCKDYAMGKLVNVFSEDKYPFVLMLENEPQEVIDKLVELLSFEEDDGRNRLSIRILQQKSTGTQSTRLGAVKVLHGWVAKWLWLIREKRKPTKPASNKTGAQNMNIRNIKNYGTMHMHQGDGDHTQQHGIPADQLPVLIAQLRSLLDSNNPDHQLIDQAVTMVEKQDPRGSQFLELALKGSNIAKNILTSATSVLKMATAS